MVGLDCAWMNLGKTAGTKRKMATWLEVAIGECQWIRRKFQAGFFVVVAKTR